MRQANAKDEPVYRYKDGKLVIDKAQSETWLEPTFEELGPRAETSTGVIEG